MVHIIILKKKELNREGYITGLLEVTLKEGYLMKGYPTRKTFSFSMDVLISKIRPTNLNTWIMTALQTNLESLVHHH